LPKLLCNALNAAMLDFQTMALWSFQLRGVLFSLLKRGLPSFSMRLIFFQFAFSFDLVFVMKMIDAVR
jgi:hypothetical protein